MLRKFVLLTSVLSMMLFASLTSAYYGFNDDLPNDDLVYDPEIHVYETGMETGAMKDHIKYGTLAELNEQLLGTSETNHSDSSLTGEKTEDEIIVPIFQDGITYSMMEQGSWFYPRTWPWQSGDAQLANNVRWNSCGGGDDAWVDYYYVPTHYLFNNVLRVWATNVVSSTHIAVNGGLDGGYFCVYGWCTISVCSTQEYNANPWSVYLFYLGGA